MESEYDIVIEDSRKYAYVTIEEMKDILKTQWKVEDDYDFFGLRIDEKTGLYYTDYFAVQLPAMIYAHLLVEQCLEHIDQVDWKRVTNGYDDEIIELLQHTWENPLVWVDKIPDELTRDYLIIGKVAKELSSEERCTCYPYSNLHIKWYNERLCWFADKLPTAKDVTIPKYHSEDLILWHILTEDNFARRFPDAYSDENPNFSPRTFKQNINRIAELRGPQRAAQIVRLLREDWQDIKALKLFGIDELTPEQIEDFRLCLFEGMDRNLRKWDAEQEKQQPVEPQKCRYIDFDKLAEVGIHTPEDFTQSLRQACEQDAHTLGTFLKKNFKLGYLDFHGDSKKKIYEHLKECFPHALNYSYTNFTLYFD